MGKVYNLYRVCKTDILAVLTVMSNLESLHGIYDLAYVTVRELWKVESDGVESESGSDSGNESGIVEILNSRKMILFSEKKIPLFFKREKIQNSFGLREITYI